MSPGLMGHLRAFCWRGGVTLLYPRASWADIYGVYVFLAGGGSFRPLYACFVEFCDCGLEFNVCENTISAISWVMDRRVCWRGEGGGGGGCVPEPG